jgi:SEL1 protein
MALEYNQASYFPVVLSLIKLHLRSLWYIAAGGRQPNLILWGDDGDDDHWWPSKLWRTEPEHDEIVDPMEAPGRQHKANTPVGIMDEDQDDPVARVREIREQQARTDEDNDPGEDFYDGMTIRRGAGEGEGMPPDDEEFWESVVLAFLLVGIAGLMWLRGRYVLRREEEERRRRQEMQAAEQRERQREQRQRAAQNLAQTEDDDEGEDAAPNAPLQHQQPGAGEPPGREALHAQMAMFM